MNTKPYRIWAKKLDRVSDGVIKNCAQGFGFKNTFLLKSWSEIIGDYEIARAVKPVRLTFFEKKQEYKLKIFISDLGVWGVWKMLEESVCMKIESILGKKCKIEIEKV